MKLGFFLWILLFVKANSELDMFRPKTVRIYQFKGTCRGLENATIQYTDIQLINVNRTFHVSLKAHISKPVKNGLKLRLSLSRCRSRDALDSCETYTTIKVNHFCNILNAENKPWSEFVTLFKPPMKCPLKKVRISEKLFITLIHLHSTT
ncbi:hypothetical protein NQ314_002289 [Rhamnusium bicolor]|uniref:Uncharacterized protein n=1 Tax=Rhamnusium bicolor TaxID=1586634 RepID=A0AAV8ZQT3_9CUCU|nr:hypothetical protein NQ314_002289 [Rhamnusium bicolor]